jgi:uncharacterized membrane protein
MKLFLSFWGLSLAFLVALDMLWFSFSVERLYKPYLGYIMSGNFNYSVAAVFYLLYAAGLSFLILVPGFEANQTVLKIAINGFVLGLVAYGAYDLTNQATIKDWPAIITVIDMLWGASVTCVVSAMSYKIMTIIYR